MINLGNDSVQNSHIHKHDMQSHYDSLEKNVSKNAKDKFKTKPYYMEIKKESNYD